MTIHTFDVLVVGGGHAGAAVAHQLATLGYEGSVGIISAERHLPYERPPLSKAYLKGEATAESLLIRDAQFWSDARIELMLDTSVVTVDPDSHTVATSNGDTVKYGSLVWTTGGSARRLGVAGEDLAGVMTLRTLDDALAVKECLPTAKRFVIVGGGFVGLEAASVLRGFGIEVTVLEAQERLLQRVTSAVVSDYFLRRHVAAGVDVRLGAQVTEIEGRDGSVTGVRLADGSSVSADRVLVAVGLVPAVGPLLAAGAEGIGCIEVDDLGRTSLPDVYAAGDCASFPHGAHPSGRARIESIQNATEQGKLVASSIMGQASPYDPQLWFWSNQFDIKFKTVGLVVGYDTILIRGDKDSDSFSVVYLHGDVVVAVDTVNHMRDYVGARAAVGRRVDLNRIGDSAEPLKAVLVGDEAVTQQV
ncbi:NAD(P)/FAD-dependent oxidoreductase [Rhodococcus aetherivorans]